MISISSIYAVVLRHVYLLRRDINFMLSLLYWPVLDIMIWGFLGSWIAQAHMAQFPNYTTVALLGILLWQLISRGCNVFTITLAEELWSRNIANLFSMPLRISEWMMGIIIFYFIMMGITTVICLTTIMLLYDVSLYYLLSCFVFFAPPLIISCIWMGFMCLQIIVTLGRRGTEVAFVFGWLLAPFSGAYYPIEVLPEWGQKISAFLPMSYVFSGMRGYVMHQQDPTSYLIKGYALSSVYAACSIIIFVYCFNRAKHKGLARLAD